MGCCNEKLKNMPRRYIVLFFCFCVLIYIVFVIFSMGEPLLGDSPYFLFSAKVFNNEALQSYFPQIVGVDHPTLYVHILALVDRLIGLNPVSARSIGILSFIATLALIYVVAQNVFKEGKNIFPVGLIAVFLYAINPMAIQGSLLPDNDTTILTPLLLLFIYFFVKLKGKNRGFLLGIFFGFILWVKLTTLFILIPAIFTFYSLRGKFREGFKESGLVLFIGLVLFVISWGSYCYFTKRPYLFPLVHLRNIFLAGSPLFIYSSGNKVILNTARIALRIILYASPFYFLIFFKSFWYRLREFILRRERHSVDFLFILGLTLFCAYLFVGGLTHSFPKYHYPFLSLSAILIAGFIADKVKFQRKHLLLYGLMAASIVSYNIFLVGDFLYFSDYALRESLIMTGKITDEAAKNLVIQLVLYVFPFLLIFVILKVKKASLVFYRTVFIWTVASCLSMNILQARADYHTVYCYGGRGTKEMVSLVRKMKTRSKSIVTTQDIFYNIDEKEFLTSPGYRFPPAIFSSSKKFMEVIEDKKPDFVIFSISSNTVKQYQAVFNNLEVVNLLKKYFSREEIGSYTIWVRKEGHIKE